MRFRGGAHAQYASTAGPQRAEVAREEAGFHQLWPFIRRRMRCISLRGDGSWQWIGHADMLQHTGWETVQNFELKKSKGGDLKRSNFNFIQF